VADLIFGRDLEPVSASALASLLPPPARAKLPKSRLKNWQAYTAILTIPP